MANDQIHALLRQAMGLSVESIGQKTLDRSVNRRMKALGLDSEKGYADLLTTSARELKELVEEVVVPETWFFRDSRPFDVVIQHAMQKWLPAHPNQTLRLLSAPCSTGEEPYSLAMALLLAGWPRDKFRIEAIDISRRSLERAAQGVYTKNSFRGDTSHFKDKFFTEQSGRFALTQAVKSKVRFQRGNLLDPTFMASMGLFDIVFCRNVLIYFDETSRHQAITNLNTILADDGLLFTGHAEASLFAGSPFKAADHKQAFAFHKKKTAPAIAMHKAAATPPPPPPVAPPVRPPPEIERRPREERPVASTAPAPDLQKARALADQGHLADALHICQGYIGQNNASAEGYFLLGVLQDALGDHSTAFATLRKAVYLAPGNADALLLLSLIADKMGDHESAAVYRQRARRSQQSPEDNG